MKESKIYYLDENNNITDKEIAVKSVIQVFENGILIDEIWSTYKSAEEEKIDDMECVYVDADGKVVSQEEATQVIYKTVKDGKVISEDKFDLGKFTPKL